MTTFAEWDAGLAKLSPLARQAASVELDENMTVILKNGMTFAGRVTGTLDPALIVLDPPNGDPLIQIDAESVASYIVQPTLKD